MEFFIILILILLNGVFSMSEIALISTHKSNLTNDSRKGNRSVHIALKPANDPDKFLSTVHSGHGRCPN